VKLTLSSVTESFNNFEASNSNISKLQLEPDQEQTIDADINNLYPGKFIKPGDYWLEFNISASGGERILVHLELFEQSLSYFAGRANIILRTKLKLTGNTFTLEDPIYLRLQGDRLPVTMQLNLESKYFEGDRRILCFEHNMLTYNGPDNFENLNFLENVLINDPLEWWSQDEDNDERFKIPENDKVPGSIFKQEKLKSRLKELK